MTPIGVTAQCGYDQSKKSTYISSFFDLFYFVQFVKSTLSYIDIFCFVNVNSILIENFICEFKIFNFYVYKNEYFSKRNFDKDVIK